MEFVCICFIGCSICVEHLTNSGTLYSCLSFSSSYIPLYMYKPWVANCNSMLYLASLSGGTATAVPLPFRPSDPALCGSRPLVTSYYCRLGDLLCLFCVVSFLSRLLSAHMCFLFSSLFDLYFVASPSVL